MKLRVYIQGFGWADSEGESIESLRAELEAKYPDRKNQIIVKEPAPPVFLSDTEMAALDKEEHE